MKNKKSLTVGIIVAVIVIALIGSIAGSYNNLVKLRENVTSAQSVVETQLQRRADLIPNLVNTVKGYASHEQETLTKITEARAKVNEAKGPKELSEANAELTRAIGDINVVVEAYPDLKANQNFIQLQDELAGTENRIAVARKDYNGVVKTFNSKVRRFPTNIFAKMLGFSQREYFEAEPGAESAPSVNFGYKVINVIG